MIDNLNNHVAMFDERDYVTQGNDVAKCECWICGQQFDRGQIKGVTGFRNYNGAMIPTYPKLCNLCLEEFESGRNPIYKPSKAA
jgi:hypothetical protein